MSDCRDLEPLFAAYVDGDGVPGQRAAVEAHLVSCKPCRELVAGERAAHEVLVARREGLRACASEHLRARCAAQFRGERASRSKPVLPGWRVLVPLSLAATVILAVGGVFLYSAINQVEALAAQLAVDHMKCAQLGSVPVDPVTAGSQWASAYGWPLTVPASAPARDLEFVTVRRCLVTEGRAAHMLYTWRGQPLSVFVLPTAVEGMHRQQILDTFGHEAVMWSSGGRTYVIMARGRPEEMEPVITYVRAHAR